jgi:hypothetical protein
LNEQGMTIQQDLSMDATLIATPSSNKKKAAKLIRRWVVDSFSGEAP